MFTTMLWAQDYDYVLPDSIPEIQKRSSLTLPIKPREPQPTYYVPSYASEVQSNKAVDANEAVGEVDDENLKPKTKRTSVNLEIGTSVSSDFNGNSAIRTYAAPNIKHQVNDRLAISGGVMMSQTFFNGWKNYSIDGGPMPSTVYSNMVYGRVDYMVNERMLVYGTVFSNLTTMPGVAGYDRQLQGTGYSVGMKYKVSEKSFIQVQISRGVGYNPYMPRSNSIGFGGMPMSYFP